MISEAEEVNRQANGEPVGIRLRSIYELLGAQPQPRPRLFDLLSPAAYARNRLAELEREVRMLTVDRDALAEERDRYRYLYEARDTVLRWERTHPWWRRVRPWWHQARRGQGAHAAKGTWIVGDPGTARVRRIVQHSLPGTQRGAHAAAEHLVREITAPHMHGRSYATLCLVRNPGGERHMRRLVPSKTHTRRMCTDDRTPAASIGQLGRWGLEVFGDE